MKSIAEELKKINEMGYCTKGGNFACLCKDCRKVTNGGEPHICGTIQVHNTRLDQVMYQCAKCGMPVDNPDQLSDKEAPVLDHDMWAGRGKM